LTLHQHVLLELELAQQAKKLGFLDYGVLHGQSGPAL